MSVMTIDRTTIFQKTATGRAEIGQRLAGLAGAHRQLLIVIDGQKNVGALAALFPRADIVDGLHYLAQGGFIDAVVEARHVPVVPVPATDPAFTAFRTAIEAPVLAMATAPEPAPGPAPLPDDLTLAEAKRFMSASAKNNIGLLAEPLIARIETAQTRADLTAVASQWHMALRDSKRGKPIADALLEHALGLLGADAATHA